MELWKKTIVQDLDSTYSDNYYYRPTRCYCNDDVDGCGYSFNDEYGDCDYCLKQLRQINGHNDDIADTGQPLFDDSKRHKDVEKKLCPHCGLTNKTRAERLCTGACDE